MKLNLRSIFLSSLVSLLLVGLSSCAFMRVAGPCYGFGCPALSGSADQSKSAALAKSPGAAAQAAKSSDAKAESANVEAQAQKRDAADSQPAPASQQGN